MPLHIARNGSMTKVTRSNKFKAKKTFCAQKHFHSSRGEAMRCDVLHLFQKAGRISDLVPMCASMEVVKGFKYKPDFRYVELGVNIVEDFKGVVTQRFRDIKRLWPHHGTGVLRVSRLSGSKFVIEKDIPGIRD